MRQLSHKLVQEVDLEGQEMGRSERGRGEGGGTVEQGGERGEGEGEREGGREGEGEGTVEQGKGREGACSVREQLKTLE